MLMVRLRKFRSGFTTEEWMELFERQDASGLSQSEFCKRENLSPKTFGSKRRLLGFEGGTRWMEAVAAPGFPHERAPGPSAWPRGARRRAPGPCGGTSYKSHASRNFVKRHLCQKLVEGAPHPAQMVVHKVETQVLDTGELIFAVVKRDAARLLEQFAQGRVVGHHGARSPANVVFLICLVFFAYLLAQYGRPFSSSTPGMRYPPS